MEEQTKKMLVRGAIIGGVVGGAVAVFKSKTQLSTCITKCYRTSTEVLKFLNENRTEIVEQLKNTSEKFTKVVDETNNDLKALSGNIKHLKRSSSEMVNTVQQTKDQLVDMYETCKHKFEEELESVDKNVSEEKREEIKSIEEKDQNLETKDNA